MAFNKSSYDQQYIAAKYKRIPLSFPNSLVDEIRAHADRYDGGNVTGFIRRAIEEQMKRDQNSNS